VITPSCSPGMFRYTCFDQTGFIGHGDYASPEDALVQAYQMGFTEWSPPQHTRPGRGWPCLAIRMTQRPASKESGPLIFSHQLIVTLAHLVIKEHPLCVPQTQSQFLE
jgi:hypothetical protein